MNKKIDAIIKKNKYRSSFYKTKQKRSYSVSKHKNPKSTTHSPSRVPKTTTEDTRDRNLMTRITNQLLVAVVVFMLGLIIKHDPKFATVNHYVNSNMNLKQIDTYIITHAGRLFPLPNNDDLYVSLPVIDIYNAYDYRDGVIVSTSLYEGVTSAVEGIVVKVYTDNELGKVVVIQDNEGYLYEYGMIDDLKVGLYSRVDEGELLGMSSTTSDLEGGEYYLAIQDQGDYLDVINVVNR